jgi:serine/threonine protein kinase
MAADRPPLLFDRLRDSGLLDQAQLQELSTLPEARDPDPRALGLLILKRGWLTRFQINVIAQGRGKDLLLGPYLVLDSLGEGAMGQVFKARHRHMNRVIALKVIRKERLAGLDAIKRFYQEVEAAAQLSHPNIVIAYDAGKLETTHYLAMEYVDGTDLFRLVKESGQLSVAQACDYVRQAALGLQHAHERGLVHRDIKPSNLLLARDSEDRQSSPFGTVKILDMGLARRQGQGGKEHGVTHAGAVIGTPDYLSPEQAVDSRVADIRSDLYSLGCTMYFLLTGKPPFQAESLTELLLKHQLDQPVVLEKLLPGVPPQVAAIVRKLMAKRPADRFQSPAELIRALETAATPEAALAPGMPAAPMDAVSIDEPNNLRRGGRIRSVARDLAVLAPATDTPADTWHQAVTPDDEEEIESAIANPIVVLRSADRSRWKIVAVVCGIVAVLLAGVIIWINSRPKDTPAERPSADLTLLKKHTANEPAASKKDIEPDGGERKSDNAVPDPTSAKADPGSGKPDPGPNRPGNPTPSPEPGPVPTPNRIGEALRFKGHKSPAWCVAVSPNGRLALSGGASGELILWEVASGKVLRNFEGHTNGVWSAAFSPDGKQALSGSYDNTAILWNVADGRSLHVLRTESPIHGVGFTPDGKQGITAGSDRIPRLWNLRNGKLVRAYRPSQIELWGIAVSPNGRWALARDEETSLRLWDLSTGTAVRRVMRHSGSVINMDFSRDGRRMASCSFDGTVCLWDTATGRELRVFTGHRGPVLSAAFSPSGRRVVSGGTDRTVRLWDVTTGKELHHFEGHGNVVQRVAYLPDGRHALSASEDQTVRLWRLPDEPTTRESATTPSDSRTPPPAGEDLANAVKTIRELYRDDYSKTRHSEMSAAAQKLFDIARDEKKDSVMRFALLAEARDMAAKAADGALAFKAIEESAIDFAVEDREMKGSALQTAVKEVLTPERSALLADAATATAEEAAAADSFDEAVRLAKLAETAALKSKETPLAASVQIRRQEMEVLKKEFTALSPMLKALAENPDDAEACLAVGRYRCLVQGDWQRGLQYLARGGDGRLQDLARKEMDEPGSAEALVELADDWREPASKEHGLAQLQLLRHAHYRYRSALPKLRGSAKTAVEKRMAEIEKQVPLERLDDPIVKFKGRWTVRCEDRTVLEYVIDVLGNVKLLRRFRLDAKGNAIEVSEPKRPGTLVLEGGDVLMDLNDGKLNRIRLKGGKMYFEHFFPRDDYPDKKPYTTGQGAKK